MLIIKPSQTFLQNQKDQNTVHNGGEVMEAFAALESMSKKEQEAYRQALLAYCKLDTLAMVKIIMALEKLS